MKKVVFIIPGHKHSASQSEYQQIGSYFENVGIKPIYVDIPWKRTVISENLNYFLNQFNRIEADQKYILGFSFGAVIALLASNKVRVKAQILCSLSPYFKEDLPKIKKWWTIIIGKRRYADFFNLEAKSISIKVKDQTILIYGSEETKLVEERSHEVYNWVNAEKELIVVDGAKHDIGDRDYLEVINNIVMKL